MVMGGPIYTASDFDAVADRLDRECNAGLGSHWGDAKLAPSTDHAKSAAHGNWEVDVVLQAMAQADGVAVDSWVSRELPKDTKRYLGTLIYRPGGAVRDMRSVSGHYTRLRFTGAAIYHLDSLLPESCRCPVTEEAANAMLSNPLLYPFHVFRDPPKEAPAGTRAAAPEVTERSGGATCDREPGDEKECSDSATESEKRHGGRGATGDGAQVEADLAELNEGNEQAPDSRAWNEMADSSDASSSCSDASAWHSEVTSSCVEVAASPPQSNIGPRDGVAGDEEYLYTKRKFANLEEYRAALGGDVQMATRAEIYQLVIGAEIADYGEYAGEGTCLFRAITAFQEWGFLRKKCLCAKCGEPLRLVPKRRGGNQVWGWRGSRPNAARQPGAEKCECFGDTIFGLAGQDDLVACVHQQWYVAFLDVLVMWLHGAPKKYLYRELRAAGVAHGTVDEWIGAVQLEMAKAAQWGFREKFPIGGEGREVQIDETNINRKKKGKLNRTARRRQQRWIWGVVDSRRFEMSYLRILPYPQDAIAGKPRGQEEIARCVRESGLRPKTMVVSDGWAASEAIAWKEAFECDHDVVIHSRGEIVNERGRHTNKIEAKWSSLKRWLRSVCGGKIPRGPRLEPYVFNYQWRQMVSDCVFAEFRDSCDDNRRRQAEGGPPLFLTDPGAFGRAGGRYFVATLGWPFSSAEEDEGPTENAGSGRESHAAERYLVALRCAGIHLESESKEASAKRKPRKAERASLKCDENSRQAAKTARRRKARGRKPSDVRWRNSSGSKEKRREWRRVLKLTQKGHMAYKEYRRKWERAEAGKKCKRAVQRKWNLTDAAKKAKKQQKQTAEGQEQQRTWRKSEAAKEAKRRWNHGDAAKDAKKAKRATEAAKKAKSEWNRSEAATKTKKQQKQTEEGRGQKRAWRKSESAKEAKKRWNESDAGKDAKRARAETEAAKEAKRRWNQNEAAKGAKRQQKHTEKGKEQKKTWRATGAAKNAKRQWNQSEAAKEARKQQKRTEKGKEQKKAWRATEAAKKAKKRWNQSDAGKQAKKRWKAAQQSKQIA